MAPIVPDPKKIRSFRTAAAFEARLSKNHARETEIWLRVYKKDSGVPTVSCAQALEATLCWGWIDGIRKTFDQDSFLQRYTPRAAIEASRRAGEEDHSAGGAARARRDPHAGEPSRSTAKMTPRRTWRGAPFGRPMGGERRNLD
jgi:hypothetical protein